ncbi:MAG: M20 family metallopeptidase [Bacteroidia bacterium]|nr:M20 family metallopeptidase [Bacteroidia bacterium]
MRYQDETARRIVEHLWDREDELLVFLKALVNRETPSADKPANEEILLFLTEAYSDLGYISKHLPGIQTGGVLYARPVERKKHQPTQLLIGHADTVWPMGTITRMKVEDEDGKVRGPGVYDMKAGLAQIYFALKTLDALGLEASVLPLVLINTDEEIGSFESSRHIKRLSRVANRAYVLEPPLGTEGKLKTGRKGIGRFKISVEGVAAHAGLDPDKGANAIVELSHLVQKLYAMNDPKRGITVNVGTIEGGISPNVVAPMSKAVIDVRVLSDEDGRFITNQILKLKAESDQVKLTIEGGIGRPPMEKTDRNQKLWKVAREEGRRLGLDLKEATAGGGSDANTTSLYTATLDGLGTPGDGAHASHEYILKNKLIERTALLSLLLLTAPKFAVS